MHIVFILTIFFRIASTLLSQLTDLESRLTLSPTISEDDIDDLKRRLADAECEIEQLHGQLHTKDVKIDVLEAQLDKAMRLFRDQLGFQADHIRQLNRELHERTATVTQLSTQVLATHFCFIKGFSISASDCSSEKRYDSGARTSTCNMRRFAETCDAVDCYRIIIIAVQQ